MQGDVPRRDTIIRRAISDRNRSRVFLYYGATFRAHFCVAVTQGLKPWAQALLPLSGRRPLPFPYVDAHGRPPDPERRAHRGLDSHVIGAGSRPEPQSFRDLRAVQARWPENLGGRSDCWGRNGIQGHRGQGSRISCINLAVFLNRATRHKILELLISAQSQHFSASVCSISSAEVIM